MATKNTLFKVDVKKENPLKTILEHGKIPVLRFSDTGFQNYKQNNYFKYHEFEYHGERGCFVHIGGVHGTYVCGGHFHETLNIGYVEPDTPVLCPFNGQDKTKSNYWETAQERFNETKSNYKLRNKYSFDSDDLDLYSEAVVDSKKIKKVCEIPMERYSDLFGYSEDEEISILNDKEILMGMAFVIPDEFWKHVAIFQHENIEEINNETELDRCKNIIYSMVWDLYDNPVYAKMIMDEFKEYQKTGKFLHNDEYFQKWNENNKILKEKASEMEIKFSDVNGLFYDDWFLTYEPTDWKRKFNTININKNGKITAFYNDYNLQEHKTERKHIYITKENMLEYTNYLADAVNIIDLVSDLFSDYVTIKKPKWFKELEAFVKMEKNLQDWNFNYSYDNGNKDITITMDEFQLVYNLQLLDGVIEIFNDETRFYNLENIPETFPTVWLEIILEQFSPWRELF